MKSWRGVNDVSDELPKSKAPGNDEYQVTVEITMIF